MTPQDVDPAYVRAVLDLYRRAIGATGHVRSSDRRLAEALYRRGVAVATVENALLLATLRRLVRPAERAPLAVVRSFAYYQDVIEELHGQPLDPGHLAYLRGKLGRTVRS